MEEKNSTLKQTILDEEGVFELNKIDFDNVNLNNDYLIYFKEFGNFKNKDRNIIKKVDEIAVIKKEEQCSSKIKKDLLRNKVINKIVYNFYEYNSKKFIKRYEFDYKSCGE